MISPLYKNSLDFKNTYFCCWKQNIWGPGQHLGACAPPPPGPNVEPPLAALMHRIERQKRCTSIVERKLTKVYCSDNWGNIYVPWPGWAKPIFRLDSRRGRLFRNYSAPRYIAFLLSSFIFYVLGFKFYFIFYCMLVCLLSFTFLYVFMAAFVRNKLMIA